MIDQEAAWKLVQLFWPVMFGWFYIGIVIAVLYHLSLYYLDGEFRVKSERSLDIFVSVLRGLLYMLVWPGVFFFDRTALDRIRLFLLYLNPKQRAENEELKMYMKEREYRSWAKTRFLDQEQLEKRRGRELISGSERLRRTRTLHEGHPELDNIWLMTGVGTHPGGVRELVRLYPDYYLAEEVENKARREIELRRPWRCPRCDTLAEAEGVKIPGLQFVRVLEEGTEKLVVEGWALEGSFTVSFADCAQCGEEHPELSGELFQFGRASDVVRAVRAGLVFHWDLP